MNKKSVRIIFILFITILLLPTILASIKSNKLTYNNDEPFYVVSTVSSSDHLCRSSNPAETVKLYLVEHKDEWSEGDNFEDIRGEPSNIPNTKFSNRKIAEKLDIGLYDLIVDCNEDKTYNEASEPLYNEGITVLAKKGQASMSLGDNNPQNSIWSYNPENFQPIKEILQIKLTTKDERVILNNLSLEIKSPEDRTSIEIYIDKDNNGLLDPIDWSIAKLESAKEEEKITLDYQLGDDDENLLFILNLKPDSELGEYSIKVKSLLGIGAASSKEIRFFGNPLESNILSVENPKTCLGSINLNLDPNPVFSDEKVTARINNITGCNGLIAILKTGACYSDTGVIATCEINQNTCQIEIDAIYGDYTACIDKNDDNDKSDKGESTTKTLEIKSKSDPNAPVDLSNNNAPITGNAISDLTNLNKNTLLKSTIILIIIIFILFLIRSAKRNPDKPKEQPNEEKPEDKDFFEELEEIKKEIIDKVEEDKKASKKK